MSKSLLCLHQINAFMHLFGYQVLLLVHAVVCFMWNCPKLMRIEQQSRLGLHFIECSTAGVPCVAVPGMCAVRCMVAEGAVSVRA